MTTMPTNRPFPGRPNEPFFFGRGGKRMSAEDISMQRRLAAQQMAQGADYSPIASPWQGLARVANGLAGGFRMEGADRAAEERAARQQQSIAALLAPYDAATGAPDPVVAALADPDLRQLGMSVLETRTPKVPAPTEFERMLAGAGILPGTPEYIEANRRAAMAKSDPLITTTLPGDRFYSGPQSELASVMGGGVPTAPVGRLTPIAPTIENTPAPELSASGMPTAITRAQYQAIVAAKGQAETEAWAQRNNITVRD